MNKINWRSLAAAISALVAMLAALPYTLGDVATIIPPAWKAKVVSVSIIAAFILRAWNSVQPHQPPPSNPSP